MSKKEGICSMAGRIGQVQQQQPVDERDLHNNWSERLAVRLHIPYKVPHVVIDNANLLVGATSAAISVSLSCIGVKNKFEIASKIAGGLLVTGVTAKFDHHPELDHLNIGGLSFVGITYVFENDEKLYLLAPVAFVPVYRLCAPAALDALSGALGLPADYRRLLSSGFLDAAITYQWALWLVSLTHLLLA